MNKTSVIKYDSTYSRERNFAGAYKFMMGISSHQFTITLAALEGRVHKFVDVLISECKRARLCICTLARQSTQGRMRQAEDIGVNLAFDIDMIDRLVIVE